MENFFVKLNIPNETAMLALGKKLAAVCDRAIIFLHGELGAGKTTLTRGFLQGLGVKNHVKSPTYTLVESYQLNDRMIYHFDFYRVRDPRELDFMGIQDYFDQDALCLIEWPEQGGNLLPAPDLSCYIEQINHGRGVKLVPRSVRGEQMMHRFEYDE